MPLVISGFFGQAASFSESFSDTRALDDHIDHGENGAIENVFYCKRIYGKETRQRELAASLIMARHWMGYMFFWGGASKDDQSDRRSG